MKSNNNIGTFYQGQTISIVIATPEDATTEEKAIFKDNDLYIGIYGESPAVKRIVSTQGTSATATKQTDSNGNTTVAFVLSAKDTKNMHGRYEIEMLIKNSDNSFSSPCENIISFDVQRRKISEVIK